MATRYWCHMCSKMVKPVIDAEIKCPCCQKGFVEEMSVELNDGSSSNIREVQDSEINFGTDCASSLWGPILHGMMSNPRRRRRFRRTELGLNNDEINVVTTTDVDGNDSNVNNHHHENLRRPRQTQHDGEDDLDREFDSIIRRRRTTSAAIFQLIQGIRESSDRNQFNQSAIAPAFNLIRNNTSASATGDNYVGTRLVHLLEHLADDDPIRHVTLPANKEAVESLPTVKICEPLQCLVCLDDFDRGSEAKEMPCKHKFHVGCIVPWLELHSSCD